MAKRGTTYSTLHEEPERPSDVDIIGGFRETRAKRKQCRVWVCLGSGVAVALVLAAVLAVALSLTLVKSAEEAQSCSVAQDDRFDCLPNAQPSQSECEKARGCCWDESAKPNCYFPRDLYVYAVESDNSTPTDTTLLLKRKSGQPSFFGHDVSTLRVDFTVENSYRLRVKIYDPAHSRYEVPLPISHGKATDRQFDFNFSKETFNFTVGRRNGPTLFSSAPSLIFSDQYLSLSAFLPSANIYGLGEHVTRFKLDTDFNVLTLFSRDQPPNPDAPGNNLYGVHPFYLCVEESGDAHGVFLLNSNAMEVELQPAPAITYRTIGGILDFYFFLGPTPELVVQQYTELVGRSFMPPYWALGFHLCRWGYNTVNNTMTVVNRMREKGIPQDTQWNDIDYMHEYLDFTYDEEKFGNLPSLVENLHDHNQKYVVIVDPGINSQQPSGKYPPFDDGLNMNVFIKNSSGQPIIGVVWPNQTAFPDFTHVNSGMYWENEIMKFRNQVQVDGLWIDMNEPSNFVPGQVCSTPSSGCCPESTLNNPPFLPRAISPSTGIVEKTLCMTATQSASTHYNVHSLYGLTEANATMRALVNILGTRSLVISRSTYPSSGTHGGHWLGDNASQWKHMANSIPGILDFALFGIPLVGADICGFFDDTTEQLCTRWQQLGAFYPFSRNHNSIGNIDQDPAVWSEASVNSSRSALLLRYQLLPFLYTLFHMAHTNGTTVARPLLFEFPKDKNTWDIDRQFLWGPSLLISPVLTENATTVKAYFPQTRWYDFRTGDQVKSTGFVTLDAPMDIIPLHVRGGHVLPMQGPDTTTAASRKNPFSLLVALNESGHASGQLFIDDGESLNTVQDKNYSYITFQCDKGLLKSAVQQSSDSWTTATNSTLTEIVFYGVEQQPSKVTVNEKNVPFSWNSTNKALNVQVDVNLNIPFELMYK